MSRPRTRLLDRLLAVVGLVATSPVLLLAALGIKVSDRGQVIYRAQRTGIDGRPFTMFKLRTMRVGETADGAHITGSGDARVFPWGMLLRRLKVDELPQLVNVVRGDMAIVGPRPEDPAIVDRHYAPWMHETLTVLPGLTSPGSLEYYAEENSLPTDPVEAERIYLRDLMPRKLAADLVYVRRRTLRYEAVLVLRTMAGVVGWHDAFAAARSNETAAAARILAEVSS